MTSFFTPDEYAQLIDNRREENLHRDPVPVVKLSLADDPTTWLITGLKEDNPSIAFGMTDYGSGEEPVIGAIDLKQVRSLKGAFGFSVGRDKHFQAERPLSYYFKQAQDRAAEHRCERSLAIADADYPDGFNPIVYDL